MQMPHNLSHVFWVIPAAPITPLYKRHSPRRHYSGTIIEIKKHPCQILKNKYMKYKSWVMQLTQALIMLLLISIQQRIPKKIISLFFSRYNVHLYITYNLLYCMQIMHNFKYYMHSYMLRDLKLQSVQLFTLGISNYKQWK